MWVAFVIICEFNFGFSVILFEEYVFLFWNVRSAVGLCILIPRCRLCVPTMIFNDEDDNDNNIATVSTIKRHTINSSEMGLNDRHETSFWFVSRHLLNAQQNKHEYIRIRMKRARYT